MMATAALTKGTLRAVPFRLDGRLVLEALSRHSSRRSTAGIRRSTGSATNPTDRGRCR
jgi:hypothetical protein